MTAEERFRDWILTLPDDEELDALLLEMGNKNTVRVVYEQQVRPDQWKRAIRKRASDEQTTPWLTRAAIWRLDELRIAWGLRPRYIPAALHRWGGQLHSLAFNARPTSGVTYTIKSLGDASTARPPVAQYMGISDGPLTAAAGDVNLPATEQQRVTCAYTALANSGTFPNLVGNFQQLGSWTNGGSTTFTNIQSEGLFSYTPKKTTPLSTDYLFLENQFQSPVASFAPGDSLTITHTVAC